MKKKRLLRLVATERERAGQCQKTIERLTCEGEQNRQNHKETREKLQRAMGLIRKAERAAAFLTLPEFGSIPHCPMCDERLGDIQVRLVGWTEPDTPFTKSYSVPTSGGSPYLSTGFVNYNEWYGVTQASDENADTPTHLVYQCGCGYIFRTKARKDTPRAVIT
ncbi:Uncharacterised protein [Mycobacteroides abscessus subsp. bolletii]|uniref:hypothetical protein n=1 Tax=Mycobacteroides abscessus TaxID=36809 RepID=UPI0009A5D93E|nr:hypothetical protein [Mycobacteroides abscessus]SKR94477.1 Uncharacterised protein [Mycobacteroides abscessus subsp. bolletii]SKS03111.1 Uncharacterised protein [Mycobacteroides abscessus subsp. bolletii]DAZ90105.1 TPA_asm: hypothetical protein PROPHIFVLQ01-1_18 [Mycobacterium phage prophiFVLQ01-1]